MNRRVGYEMLAAAALVLSAAAAVLAVAGAALQEALGVGAASLCAVLFFAPGLYFLGYSRRLRTRDLALVHAAGFVRARGAIELHDLAEELHVSRGAAEHVLRIALQEGHVHGHFEGPERFVAEGSTTPSRERPE